MNVKFSVPPSMAAIALVPGRRLASGAPPHRRIALREGRRRWLAACRRRFGLPVARFFRLGYAKGLAPPRLREVFPSRGSIVQCTAMNASVDDIHPRRLELGTPLRRFPGCDDRAAEGLARLGLRQARDLLFNFPRAYEPLGHVAAIADLQEHALCTVHGEVEEVGFLDRGGSNIFSILLTDGKDFMRCVWFNQPFHRRRLRRGMQLTVIGKPKLQAGRWEMSHPRYEPRQAASQDPLAELLPVYRLTEGISQDRLRSWTAQAVSELAPRLTDVLPADWRESRDLCGIADAVRGMHAPANESDWRSGRRRLAYQELLVLQTALALRRQSLHQGPPAMEFPATPKIDARIRRLFPFELTEDQHRAILEVAEDMAKPVPMNRLLQGDVGVGKTVVAIYAMLLTVAHGGQAVLMSPTEVLARQHARTLAKRLQGSRVRLELLTGSITASQRERLAQQTAAGEIDLVVGTQAILHALREGQDLLPRLGLVIIDEQHRFGVLQRARLRGLAHAPHYLVMTATPIPRTAAMSLYGDLDVTALRQGPQGRPPVNTYRVEPSRQEAWWTFFARKLGEGRQGFVVAPRVRSETGGSSDDDNQGPSAYAADIASDETEVASVADAVASEVASEVASVEALYEELANGPLEAFRLGLVHGGMSSAEKDSAMRRFEDGELQVLVASSVVEVGVDVPNATLMTILSAERFGLAALHQLRGRVARGSYPGFVGVFADPKTEAAQQRLEALINCNDGFELAELDLRLRGPGDLFGVKQHGLPPLRIANLQDDEELMLAAHQDARALVGPTGPWESEAWSGFRQMVLKRYGPALDLSDVG